MARPMVELARLPGPKRLLRELMPSSPTTGPLTITKTAAPPMLDDGPHQVEGRRQHGLGGGQHHGHVLRLAAGHHRVGGYLLGG